MNLAVQSAITLFKVYKEDRELGDYDDSDSDSSDNEVEECNELSPFFKLRMMFKKLKRPELQIKFRNFCDLFSEKYISPIIDVCTRWNSTYNMLKAVLGMKRSINPICVETDFTQWQFTEDG